MISSRHPHLLEQVRLSRPLEHTVSPSPTRVVHFFLADPVCFRSRSRRPRAGAAFIAALLASLALPAQAAPLSPYWAIGFQDVDDTGYSGCSNPLGTQTATQQVSTRDGVYSPQREGCILFDWYGTGNSAEALDGISVHFHVPPATEEDLVLRLYLQRGDHTDLDPLHNHVHSLKIYRGPFNSADQDCNWPECGSIEDEFPGDRHWEGWVERSIPSSWVVDNALDVTIRLWDARVDAIELIPSHSTPTLPSSWGSLKARYR